MGNVSVVELVRPMASDFLEQEVWRRQKERGEEIEALEARLEKDSEPDPDWVEERLTTLRSVNGTQDAEELLADNTIKIALRSITRRQAMKRGQLQTDAKAWLTEQAGAKTYEDVNIHEVDDDIGETWMAMYQAADIMVAIVPEQCKGWDIPKSQEEWADAPDWIFVKALSESWALNPQFVLGAMSGELKSQAGRSAGVA